MRIAQVMTASAGGIGRHVASLASRLLTLGHDVTVYCPEATAGVHGFSDLGVEVRPLTQLYRARRADVLHAHGYKAGALAVAAAAIGGPPVVVTWHNAILGRTRGPGPSRQGALDRRRELGRRRVLGRLNQLLVARGADLTLGASSDLVAEARRLGARAARLGPVAAPVLPAVSQGRNQLREELGIADHDVLVLTVGRLAPQKNLDMVLDTAAKLAHRRGIEFAIVGEGPERPRLTDRIRRQRLPVRLLGSRSDIAGLLHAADLMLLTSTWEARALVAQEALLAGLPLVATRVGGIEELVGDAAILLPPGDASAAADAVVRLADDPGRRAELTAAGRSRAGDWPDEDAVTADVCAAYRDVIASSSRAREPG